jgi:hypothetical protein
MRGRGWLDSAWIVGYPEVIRARTLRTGYACACLPTYQQTQPKGGSRYSIVRGDNQTTCLERDIGVGAIARHFVERIIALVDGLCRL